jgi:hypothetical protein
MARLQVLLVSSEARFDHGAAPQHTRLRALVHADLFDKVYFMQTKLCWISENCTRTDELFKCLDVADRCTCIQAL